MTTAFYHDERCLWHTTGEHALILPVGGTFGLDRIGDAVRASLAPGKAGKILLRP